MELGGHRWWIVWDIYSVDGTACVHHRPAVARGRTYTAGCYGAGVRGGNRQIPPSRSAGGVEDFDVESSDRLGSGWSSGVFACHDVPCQVDYCCSDTRVVGVKRTIRPYRLRTRVLHTVRDLPDRVWASLRGFEPNNVWL